MKWKVTLDDVVDLETVPVPTRLFKVLNVFHTKINDDEVDIEKGFLTDLASVPSFLQGFVQNDEPDISRGAVLHDKLYQHQGDVRGPKPPYTRADCDGILRDAMLSCGAPKWRAWGVWAALRVGGWVAWNGAGLRRVTLKSIATKPLPRVPKLPQTNTTGLGPSDAPENNQSGAAGA